MELRAHARRMDAGSARRPARAPRAALASTWREPRQRRVLLALAAAAVSAIVFADVAEDYLTNDPLARWDVSFARWLAGERSGLGTDVFRAITFLGSPATAVAIATVVTVVLYRRRRIADALLLPLVLVGAQLLNLVLKLAFHRPRPEYAFVHLDTYSFPSGHAMSATALYGALAYLAWGRVPTRAGRAFLLAATVVLVSLISFSRLYLGVHYLSDVLAGVAGGAFWLSVAIALQTVYGERLAARLTRS